MNIGFGSMISDVTPGVGQHVRVVVEGAERV